MRTVIDAVCKYGKRLGYDGLFTDECGCTWDDICPCGNYFGDCEFGYKHKSQDTEFAFIISGEPPTENEEG